MANVKISQLTAKGSKIASTDRVPIAQDNGGGTFATKYVTGAEINEVLLDTSPQLGGDLDVNGNKITSASNGNIKIEPNGTGAVLIGGNDTQPSELRFMELLSNGSSYVGFKAPNDIITSRVYTLPTADGTNGQVLSTNGTGTLSWATAGGGLTIGTTAITSGTVGRILFEGTGNVVQEDAAFFWDNTNKRLGVGATPSVELDVNGRFNFYQTNNGKGRLSLINNTGTGNFLTFTYTATGYPGTSMFNAGVGFNFVGGNNYHGEITLARTAPSGLITTRIGASNDSYLSESNLVLGATTAGARLDVRAQGALSTDIAFRVRNSADTANIIEQRGDGNLVLNGNTARMTYSSSNNTGSITHHSRADSVVNLKHSFTFFQSGFNDGSQSTAPKLNMICADITSYGINNGFHWYFNNNLNPLDSERAMWLTPKKTLSFFSGTGPDAYTSKADSFELYSADITAGNAAPHFRTENGAIVKVYQETTGVGASTLVSGVGTPLTDTDTFDGYTLKQIVKALRNQGLLA